ncbi:MAG: hypothetical protein C0598_08845 [Marinilabiliales bacterium]|nr:MAG: hypothetical protein C0598_08845 [Marinilabiliales bacterium]
MSNNVFKTFGKIIKKEKVATVQNETNTNILVLETLSPFPGYHGSTVPDNLEPNSLFAITKTGHNEEFLQRRIQEVRDILPYDFDAAPAFINVQNETRSAIRFKDLKYELVGDVTREFVNKGIQFSKTKKVSAADTIIRVYKFFNLEEIKKDFYRESEDHNTKYFTIPTQLRWSTFEKMTMSTKYNLDDNNFDAAIAVAYINNAIVDFVRIYDNDPSIKKLEVIRKKYLEAFTKM